MCSASRSRGIRRFDRADFEPKSSGSIASQIGTDGKITEDQKAVLADTKSLEKHSYYSRRARRNAFAKEPTKNRRP